MMNRLATNYYDDIDINDYKFNDNSLDNKFIAIYNLNKKKLLDFLKTGSNDLYIICQDAEGMQPIGITNFYHFFYSCYIPLFEFILLHNTIENLNLYLINRIGNMHKILDEVILLSKIKIKIFYYEKIMTRNKYLTFNESLFLQYKMSIENNLDQNNSNKITHYIVKIIDDQIHLFLPSYDLFLGDYYYDKRNLTISSYTKKIIIRFMKKITKKEKIKKYNIVIIKRQIRDSNPRYITNLDIVGSMISNYIEEPIFCDYLDNLTFGQQFKLIRRAKLVIAQHGAGLSNIFFMKPSSAIIELHLPPINKFKVPFGSHMPYLFIAKQNKTKLPLYDKYERYPQSHFINLADYCNLKYYCLTILKTEQSTLGEDQIKIIFKMFKNIINKKIINKKYNYIDKVQQYIDFKNFNSIIWRYLKIILNNNYIIKNTTDKKELDKLIKYFWITDNKYIELSTFFKSINPPDYVITI